MKGYQQLTEEERIEVYTPLQTGKHSVKWLKH